MEAISSISNFGSARSLMSSIISEQHHLLGVVLVQPSATTSPPHTRALFWREGLVSGWLDGIKESWILVLCRNSNRSHITTSLFRPVSKYHNQKKKKMFARGKIRIHNHPSLMFWWHVKNWKWRLNQRRIKEKGATKKKKKQKQKQNKQ